MEVYSNIISSFLFISVLFLIMFISRMIGSIKNLSNKIDEFISFKEETQYDFCILQIKELKNTVNKLLNQLN